MVVEFIYLRSRKMFKVQDHYFHKAKQQGYMARSAFKLEEIDKKYHIFDRETKNVLDIGCAPGSWLQYVHSQIKQLHKKTSDEGKMPWHIIGMDLKPVALNLPGLHTYVQDIEDFDGVKKILDENQIKKFDIIISDMAPNTIWLRDIDALRSVKLLEKTLWIYENFLKPEGKVVIKIFMGPWFDQFLQKMRAIVWAKGFKTFKPQAVRKESKEIYIVKF